MWGLLLQWGMSKKTSPVQTELEMVTLESLVPADHLLCKIDAVIDFGFTVDGRPGIITDTHVTPANVHDSIPYLARLDRQVARFGLEVKLVGPDAGHASAPIAKGLEDRGILGVTGYRRPTPTKPA